MANFLPQNLHTNTELYLNSQHSVIIASAQIQYVVSSAIVLDLTTFQKTGPITDVYFQFIVYYFHTLKWFGLVCLQNFSGGRKKANYTIYLKSSKERHKEGVKCLIVQEE